MSGKNMSETGRAFGAALRTLRLEKGVAQETLAHAAGLERAHVSLLERGRGNPTLDTICKILSTLEVSLPEFALELEFQLQLLSDKRRK